MIYTRLPAGGTYYPICMFPGVSGAFSAFVYGYPSLYGPICKYTGHACRHLPSAVPWISEDRLFGTFNGPFEVTSWQ